MRRLSLLMLLLLSAQLYGMQNSSSSGSQTLLGKITNMFWEKKISKDTPTDTLRESTNQSEDPCTRELIADAQHTVRNMWFSTPCGAHESTTSPSGHLGAIPTAASLFP